MQSNLNRSFLGTFEDQHGIRTVCIPLIGTAASNFAHGSEALPTFISQIIESCLHFFDGDLRIITDYSHLLGVNHEYSRLEPELSLRGTLMRLPNLLMAATVFAGVAFAEDDSDESKAIAKVELLGGKVTRNELLPGRPVVGVDFKGSQRISDKYLHLLRAFPKLSKLDFTGCKQITDAGLVEIRKLNDLTALLLAETKVTDAGLDELRNHPNLAIVDLFDTDVGEAGLSLLRNFLPKYNGEISALLSIQRLGGQIMMDNTLPGSPVGDIRFGRAPGDKRVINDKQLYLLKSFKNLSRLHFLVSPSISDAGIKDLKELRSLTHLSLCGPDITDVGVKELTGLTNLRGLELYRVNVTDEGLKELRNFPNLIRLSLNGCRKITDEGMKELCGLQSLKILSASSTHITDAGLTEIGKVKTLTELRLDSTGITDAGLKELKELQNLTVLSIEKTQISKLGLTELYGLENLKMLWLVGTDTKIVDLKELKQALPGLQVIR